jgi:hypothetical protein
MGNEEKVGVNPLIPHFCASKSLSFAPVSCIVSRRTNYLLKGAAMDANVQESIRSNYIRPEKLTEGEEYVWLEPHPCGDYVVQETVRFVGYAPCPATVIVRDISRQRIYVSRLHLFRVIPRYSASDFPIREKHH